MHEFAGVDIDVDVEIGRIDAGTVAAIRFEVQGIVDGEPVVVVEHDTRIHDDAAPDWPQCRGGDNCYRVLIAGRPKLTCELDMEDEHGGDGGLIACSMRVVNAIPAVCAAPPGLHVDARSPAGLRPQRARRTGIHQELDLHVLICDDRSTRCRSRGQ